MPDVTLPSEGLDLIANIMEANSRWNTSVARSVEENLQEDAIRARDMVVSMIGKLWELSDQIDSYKLCMLVGDFEAKAASRLYYQPFYFETEEHKKRMEDIDNGIFPS